MSSYIEVRNVSKSFSGRAILQNISLSVEQGTTVGLVGANGSGKSVLFKIICGFEKPDQGSVYVRGRQIGKNGRDFPADMGVFINSPGFIGIYSGFQNLKFLADIQGKIGEKEIRQTMTKVGLDPDNKAKVDNYSLGMKQKLGLAQAIMEGQDILILDEPFNALDYKTYEDVKAIIRMLKAEGKVIIYVSHRMAEIRQIADRVAIFKDGRFVGDSPMDAITDKELVKKMVGRDLGDVFSGLDRNKTVGDVVLEVKNLSSPFLKDASFQVRAGEVVGFSGLVGAGRTEVVRAIIGADPRTGGKVFLNGKPLNCRTPHDAIVNGVVMVPEDRKLQGIIPRMSVGRNISIGSLDQITNRLGFVNTRREEQIGLEGKANFNIKTPDLEKPIVELSGGNQQKAIVARWMSTKPEVLILDEPTKGIDVGAKSEFYNMICEFAKEGLAVILISSELPEVIGLSDRIIVMRGRRIVGEISAKDATEEKLLSMAMMEET